jgi:hypothetical protein
LLATTTGWGSNNVANAIAGQSDAPELCDLTA